MQSRFWWNRRAIKTVISWGARLMPERSSWCRASAWWSCILCPKNNYNWQKRFMPSTEPLCEGRSIGRQKEPLSLRKLRKRTMCTSDKPRLSRNFVVPYIYSTQRLRGCLGRMVETRLSLALPSPWFQAFRRWWRNPNRRGLVITAWSGSYQTRTDSFRSSLVNLREPNVLVSRIGSSAEAAGVTVLSWAYLI